MADKKGTESTDFIVGMVFFAIGVLLLVFGIILVSYYCIYRKRKRRYEKKQLSTTNHSIVYTKPDPLTLTLPPNNVVHENGHIKAVTTLSPLESPRTVYSLENGSTRGENFLLTTADGPKLHQPFDSVDNNKYVLKEVYTADKKKAKKNKVKRAFSSQSWDKKWSGGGSLFGTKKKHTTKTERIYRPVYVRDGYSTAPRDRVYHYNSNPSVVKAYPTSISSLPGGARPTEQRVYIVDRQPASTQSVILTRSPRSPRSLKFSTTSFDGLHDFENDNVFHKTHDTSHAYSLDHVDSTDADSNYLRWSPTMKRRLEENDHDTRTNSEITSVSRNGRRRGVEEHKYIYSAGNLKQF